MDQDNPPLGKVTFGLVLASALTALPTVLFGPFVVIALPIGIIVAGGHAFLIGLPTYLVLRRRFALGYINSAAAGFVVGLLPVTLYLSLAFWRGPPPPGWERVLIFMPSAIAGILGAIGGIVFRAVVGDATRPDYAATFE